MKKEYLAVDEDGFIAVYDNKPERNKSIGEWSGRYYKRKPTSDEINLYSHITWNDDPVEITTESKECNLYNQAIDDVVVLLENHEEEIYIGVFEDILKLKR